MNKFNKRYLSHFEDTYIRNAYINDKYENYPITKLNFKELLLTAIDALKISLITKKNGVIFFPGRSAAWHAKALNFFRDDLKIFAFPYSGCPYVNLTITPCCENLNNMRVFLKSIGVSPSIWLNNNEVTIIDYVKKGRTILSLLSFFSHWAHDIENNKVSTITAWKEIESNNKYYINFKRKLSVTSIYSKTNFSKKDTLKDITLNIVPSNPLLINELINNQKYCIIPSLMPEYWGINVLLLRVIYNTPPKEALETLEELMMACRYITKLMNNYLIKNNPQTNAHKSKQNELNNYYKKKYTNNNIFFESNKQNKRIVSITKNKKLKLRVNGNNKDKDKDKDKTQRGSFCIIS